MTPGTGSMIVGIHTFVTDESIHPAVLGRAIEERGFDALFLAEHSHIPVQLHTPYPHGDQLPRALYRALDPFTTLGTVAAVTTELLLGTGVCLPVQRDPIQLAKEVASLDHVSGGRMVLGVGAGWVREEMANHGTDPRTRGALLDERLAAMVAIWTEDAAEFHGRYVDFDPIAAWPKPVRTPHPPIFVGGHGPRAAARAARFGGWLPAGVGTPVEVAAQRALAPDVPLIANAVTPDQDLVGAYRAAGAAGVTFHLTPAPQDDTLRALDRLAELLG